MSDKSLILQLTVDAMRDLLQGKRVVTWWRGTRITIEAEAAPEYSITESHDTAKIKEE